MPLAGSERIRGSDDRALVAALLVGEPESIAQFLEEISPTVWSICCALSGYESEARDKFIDTMALLRAGGFARFRTYNGRSSLKTFAALVVRDALALQILQLLQSDRPKGWRAFEQLFDADIHHLIGRRLPGPAYEDIRRDAYQNICLALIDNDYRRIKAYSGKGSFSGFVLRSVDNLLIDQIRSNISPRRRPRASAGQVVRIFPSPDDVGEPAEPSPEDRLLQAEHDEQLTAALDVLTRAMKTLPDLERLYLTIVLSGTETPSSREIARIMQRPVEDIYALRQRVVKRLRDVICEESAVKNWRASV